MEIQLLTRSVTLILLVAAILVYFRIAEKFRIVDHPNERSSHSRVTVRGGGIIFPLAALLWSVFNGFSLPWLIAGILLIAAVSFLDDLMPMSSILRFLVHLLAVTFLFWQVNVFRLSWPYVFAAYVLAIGWINAFNFMDGINGITPFYALVSLGTFLWIDKSIDFAPDGLIITGAPVERMAFEDVEYWDELCAIFEWTKTHVTSTFHICWGAQAGLYYHWGVPKYMMEKKLSGVYRHRVVHKNSILFRGFDDTFMVPHSRYTTVRREDILAHPEMKILAESDEAGVYAISTHGGRQIFITGHSEYDADTLEKEYLRDKNAGLHPDVPCNYYPDDDDTRAPICSWRSSANLLYCNWLNYFVYQATPYDLNSVGIVVMDDFKEQHE